MDYTQWDTGTASPLSLGSGTELDIVRDLTVRDRLALNEIPETFGLRKFLIAFLPTRGSFEEDASGGRC